MPNRDGTGPWGKGSKTGRGLGRCNPKDQTPATTEEKDMESGRGRGQGTGQGSGQGRGQGTGQGSGQGRGRGRGRQQ